MATAVHNPLNIFRESVADSVVTKEDPTTWAFMKKLNLGPVHTGVGQQHPLYTGRGLNSYSLTYNRSLQARVLQDAISKNTSGSLTLQSLPFYPVVWDVDGMHVKPPIVDFVVASQESQFQKNKIILTSWVDAVGRPDHADDISSFVRAFITEFAPNCGKDVQIRERAYSKYRFQLINLCKYPEGTECYTFGLDYGPGLLPHQRKTPLFFLNVWWVPGMVPRSGLPAAPMFFEGGGVPHLIWKTLLAQRGMKVSGYGQVEWTSRVAGKEHRGDLVALQYKDSDGWGPVEMPESGSLNFLPHDFRAMAPPTKPQGGNYSVKEWVQHIVTRPRGLLYAQDYLKGNYLHREIAAARLWEYSKAPATVPAGELHLLRRPHWAGNLGIDLT